MSGTSDVARGGKGLPDLEVGYAADVSSGSNSDTEKNKTKNRLKKRKSAINSSLSESSQGLLEVQQEVACYSSGEGSDSDRNYVRPMPALNEATSGPPVVVSDHSNSDNANYPRFQHPRPVTGSVESSNPFLVESLQRALADANTQNRRLTTQVAQLATQNGQLATENGQLTTQNGQLSTELRLLKSKYHESVVQQEHGPVRESSQSRHEQSSLHLPPTILTSPPESVPVFQTENPTSVEMKQHAT